MCKILLRQHYLRNYLNNSTDVSVQIQEAGKGDVTITNDGATILKRMQVLHPTAKMVKIVVYVHF